MRKIKSVLLLFILSGLLLAACDATPTVVPNTSKTTDVLATAAPASSGDAGDSSLTQSVTELWRAQPGNFMRSTPVVSDGVVYATFEDYCICAFSAATGEKLWGIDPPGVSLSAPVVADGIVFLTLSGDLRIEPEVTQTAYIYALDAKTGDGRWRYKVPDAPDENAAAPVIDNGIVYFASGYTEYAAYDQGSAGHITALDPATGSVIWQKTTKGSQSSGFALANDTVFMNEGLDIGSLGNSGYNRDKDILYALDSKTGVEKWHLDTDYPMTGNLVVQGDRLYVDKGESLIALNIANGSLLWEVNRAGKNFSTPYATADKLYVAENDQRDFCIDNCGPAPTYVDHFVVLDAASGAELLRSELGEDGPFSFQFYDGLLYYTTFRPNAIKVLDPNTGKTGTLFEAEDSLGDGLAFDGGVIYIGIDDGSLVALLRSGYSAPTPLPASAGDATPVVTATVAVQEGPMKGFRGPDFDLIDIHTGEHVKLSELRGKGVFLNFWATWCPPCKEEMPDIQSLYPEYKDSVAFIGISGSVEDTAEKAKAFVDENHFVWQFVHDPDSDASAAYFSESIPTSYFLDKDGIIRALHVGQMTPDQIKGYLDLIK